MKEDNNELLDQQPISEEIKEPDYEGFAKAMAKQNFDLLGC